jgi:hypothetical protein
MNESGGARCVVATSLRLSSNAGVRFPTREVVAVSAKCAPFRTTASLSRMQRVSSACGGCRIQVCL